MGVSKVEIASELGSLGAPTVTAWGDPDASASAVSWGAILAGAAAAAGLSLILLILGTGLGLSSVSPWAEKGVSASTFGVSTIVWIIVTQLLASAIGGYLAGRLRTRWAAVHTDEVYFRDTAHGLLAWAVASLASAALLASTIGAIVGTGVQAAAAAGTAATTAAAAAVSSADAPAAAEGDSPLDYYLDSLFRQPPVPAAAASAVPGAAAPIPAPPVAADASSPAPTAEVGRIFALGAPSLPPEDLRYVSQLVAQRTGLSPQEAQQRVSDTYARLQAKLRESEQAAKAAADKARKASAQASLWLFISLLAGAFIASLAATWGGRQRDEA